MVIMRVIICRLD